MIGRVGPPAEPEPGSLGLTQERRRREAEAASWLTSDVRPVLGHVERSCADCGREWTTAPCSSCGSNTLRERYVEPVPLELKRPGLLQRVLGQKAEIAPPAPADMAALERLAAALRTVEAALPDADAASRRLVNRVPQTPEVVARLGRDVADLTILQAKLDEAAQLGGDTAASSPMPLGKVSLGLRYLIEDALGQLQRERS